MIRPQPSRLSTILGLVCLTLMTIPIQAQDYDLIDLGTLGGTRSGANAISESGIIAGYAATASGEVHTVLWINGVIQDLGMPPFGWGKAVGVNDAGQVAVTGEGSPQSYRGFLWEEDTWTELGLLPGRNECIPEEIDGHGRIVGTCLTLGQANSAAFIWDAGEMSDLGTLSGTARAYGINQSGKVVGHCWANQQGGNGEQRAFLWENDVMAELRPLADRLNSHAFGLNDLGDVVGSSWSPVGPYGLSADRATLWRNGRAEIVDLGRTPGPPVCSADPYYTDNIALAINSHEQIVGHAQCIASGGSLAAFLWQDGVMYNLNDLIPPGSGWDLIKALDINDAGEIVGLGIAPGGGSYIRAFLLVPTDPSMSVSPNEMSSPHRVNVAPNPFHLDTRISYVLQTPGPVCVSIHDIAGRYIATLRDGFQPAGSHSLTWDAVTYESGASQDGIYFVRVGSNDGVRVRRLIRFRR
ncbi:T9SS type A sorting domain-containing protein [Candidatus Eisenbacteria bacterium]|uniref:T9SS type A sorting domain-containing protein n=1 Tax=Eiseniibacteriota bacterium TaxID=2212470 RepID=A0ABV6YIQ0_UNCEI